MKMQKDLVMIDKAMFLDVVNGYSLLYPSFIRKLIGQAQRYDTLTRKKRR